MVIEDVSRMAAKCSFLINESKDVK